MNAQLKHLLDAIVAGDVGAVGLLDTQPASALEDLGEHEQFVLSAAAVIRVLDEYTVGMWPQDQVQRWAQLMRWGIAATQAGNLGIEIEVDYDPDAEDAIVEAIGRLDELGDIIDGELRPGEAAELRQALLARAAT